VGRSIRAGRRHSPHAATADPPVPAGGLRRARRVPFRPRRRPLPVVDHPSVHRGGQRAGPDPPGRRPGPARLVPVRHRGRGRPHRRRRRQPPRQRPAGRDRLHAGQAVVAAWLRARGREPGTRAVVRGRRPASRLRRVRRPQPGVGAPAGPVGLPPGGAAPGAHIRQGRVDGRPAVRAAGRGVARQSTPDNGHRPGQTPAPGLTRRGRRYRGPRANRRSPARRRPGRRPARRAPTPAPPRRRRGDGRGTGPAVRD